MFCGKSVNRSAWRLLAGLALAVADTLEVLEIPCVSVCAGVRVCVCPLYYCLAALLMFWFGCFVFFFDLFSFMFWFCRNAVELASSSCVRLYSRLRRQGFIDH